MATDIIDTAMGLSTLPATYTGPGTVAGASRNSGGVTMQSSSTITSRGNAIQVNVGFRPIRVKVINWTDGITWEWMYGAPATNTLKLVNTGPVSSIDTGSAIVVSEPGGVGSGGNWIVTLSATLTGTSKVLSIEVF